MTLPMMLDLALWTVLAVAVAYTATLGFVAVNRATAHRQAEAQASLLTAQAELASKEAAVKRAEASRARAKKTKQNGQETGDLEDVDWPPWLVGIAQGAGLDVDALKSGDPATWGKAMELLEQHVPDRFKKRGETEGLRVLG